jgi:hypothetical protein
LKIAVLASRQDASYLVPLLRVLKELGISAYALSIAPGWIYSEKEKVMTLIDEATHFILVTNSRSVETSWFGFAAGNSANRRSGLSLFRTDPACNLPGYIGGFPVFEDLDEVRLFFDSRKGEWLVQEARQDARSALLERGISLHTDSLAVCIGEGDVQAVELFLDAGFNPDLRDRHGVPLLCLAARGKHRKVAACLLERGASIDLQSEDRGYSALMYAALAGDPGLVAFLLEKGADPDLRSKDGQTALVIAVGRKDIPSVEFLLKWGADPDIPDKLGLSARGYSGLFKQAEMKAQFDEIPKKLV